MRPERSARHAEVACSRSAATFYASDAAWGVDLPEKETQGGARRPGKSLHPTGVLAQNIQQTHAPNLLDASDFLKHQ